MKHPSNKAKEKTQEKNNINWIRVLSILYPIVLFLVFVPQYQKIFDQKIHLGGDNAGYYILGKALAEGDGYTNVHIKDKVQANHFPLGYPVVVASVMKLFSYDFNAIKTANGVLLFFSLIILFFLFRRFSGNIHLAFIVTLLLVYNSHLLQYSTIMMSEIAFLLFSCLTLVLFLKSDLDKSPLKNGYFYLFLISLTFTYYIRTVGIALFGGVFLYLLLKRNWKYIAAQIIGFFLLALPWYIRGKMLGGNSYMRSLFYKNPYRPEEGFMELGDWFIRFFNNVERYIAREIPTGVLGTLKVNYKADITSAEWALGVVFVLLAGYGLYRLKRDKLLLLGYFIGTFGILFLWPDVWFGIRFLLPLVPFILFFIINGTYELLKLAFRKIKIQNNFLLNVLLPFVFLLGITVLMPNVKRLEANAKGVFVKKYKNYFEIATWAKKNTEKEAVICCRKGQLFYLYADRYVTGYKNTLNQEELIEGLKEKNVDYVVLEQLGYASTGRYLYPAIKKYPEKFEIVKYLKDPDTYLMKFHPDNGYEGDFKDDKKHGAGTFKWSNGMRYEGEWEDNKRSGQGRFFWGNGNSFKGEWENDKRNGKGVMYFKGGNWLEAIWVDDEIQGKGIIKDKNNNIIKSGIWSDNVFISSQ